jgi:protein-S-isoprenylcysteine O-methyltransferase Ste14
MHLEHAIVLLNFAYIGALPRMFFKKGGRLNGNWWLTAAPFALAVTSVLAAVCSTHSETAPYGAYLSACLSLMSVSLISFAIGSNRIPLSLWHQNDAPQEIVTWGAYRFVRHPFYTAFLLAFASAICAAPSMLSLLAGILGYLLLNRTAAMEERKLSNSQLGTQYKDYLGQTGRFLPGSGVKSHA